MKKYKIKHRFLGTSIALLLMAVLGFVALHPNILAAPGDFDNDSIADDIDLDSDNDGILDANEKYCNESTQNIAGSGAYKRSLHFFN